MTDFINDFIFTLIESILLYWIINSVMTCKVSGLQKLLSLILAILINTFFATFISPLSAMIKAILFFAVSLTTVNIIYREKIYIKAFFVISTVYIFLISDIIVGNLSSYIINTDIEKLLNAFAPSLLFSILSKITNIVLAAIFIRFFRKIEFEISKKYWIVMDMVIILFSVILQFFMNINLLLQKQSNYYSIYILGITGGFFIMSTLIIYLFGEICFFFGQQKQNYILKLKNHELEQQLAYQETSATDLKKIRHDINNNLANISYLMKQNNIIESSLYINAITSALEETKSIANSGNNIIDAILNYKIVVCKKDEIKVHINVDNLPKLNISPIDLSAILANILDNAIEANDTVELAKRYISIKIFCYKNYLSIVVKNPFNHHLVVENNVIKTSKEDIFHHGYGLSSIKSSTEKYCGSFKYCTQNNVFSAIVMLPIESNSD